MSESSEVEIDEISSPCPHESNNKFTLEDLEYILNNLVESGRCEHDGKYYYASLSTNRQD